MRFIPTGVHGVMDYLVGVLLIGIPFIVGFGTGAETGIAVGNAATYVPVLLGFGTIIYSLCTNYELGVLRVIPMRAHLALDAAAGVFLAASPWIFGFASIVFVPHLVIGLFEIGAALLTDPEPFKGRLAARSTASPREDARP